MRVSFDFLVSGFTVGCSISRDKFSLSSVDNSLLQGVSLPSLQSAILSIIIVVSSILAFRCWRASHYAAVSYIVPIPDQCGKEWKGEILENPSIKVCVRSDSWLVVIAYEESLQRILRSTAIVRRMDSILGRSSQHLQKILMLQLLRQLLLSSSGQKHLLKSVKRFSEH